MMPEQLDRDAAKDAVKEALKEWMDEKFTRFGKWSASALAAAALAALVYFILMMNGYRK